MRAKRSYPALLQRLKASLPNKHARIHQLGLIHANQSTYPIIKIVIGEDSPHKVMLAAGIHGDEPAGVVALYEFLKGMHYKPFTSKCEITLLPCINPTGYEAGTRVNHNNIDLNRKFRVKKPPPEVKCVKSAFNNHFDMSLELHEDYDSDGFYIYEAVDDKGKTVLGNKMLQAVKKIIPINMSKEIDGMPATKGIIRVEPTPKEMRWWPMAIYSMTQGTQHFLTLETPSDHSINNRVAAHLAAVKTALSHYISSL